MVEEFKVQLLINLVPISERCSTLNIWMKIKQRSSVGKLLGDLVQEVLDPWSWSIQMIRDSLFHQKLLINKLLSSQSKRLVLITKLLERDVMRFSKLWKKQKLEFIMMIVITITQAGNSTIGKWKVSQLDLKSEPWILKRMKLDVLRETIILSNNWLLKDWVPKLLIY